MSEFLIAHALHFLVGAFLVWFLWKAVAMHLAVEDDADLNPVVSADVDRRS